MLAELAPGSALAGVFTTSKTRSAPVIDCEQKLGEQSEAGEAIIVNAGIANDFIGAVGFDSVKALTGAVSDRLNLPETRVFSASTGVIGERLPHEKIVDKIDHLGSQLAPGGFDAAARAIMTTDTFPKGAHKRVMVGDKPIEIAGIAKGSGMIAPDMATMLVYIFTDALCDQTYMQELLRELNAESFNCITVDGDTSTSDTLMLAATGASGIDVTQEPAFRDGLAAVMLDLAHQVVRDGEGAQKFVTISVTGSTDNADAKRVGMAIANSPLVKTAIAGEDPNWGRVVMAIGKSGATADRDRLSIRFGDVLVAENGLVHPNYNEAEAAAHMKGQEITISVDLGLGSGAATVWTCDLTAQYIAINADYRS